MDSKTFDGFVWEKGADGIATIRFNRPEALNPTDPWLHREVADVLLHANLDDEVKVVVFTGTGRAFVAGDDLRGLRRESEPPEGKRGALRTYASLRNSSQLLIRAIRDFDKVTIASINGFAIQTGLSIALACDFRIAAEEARLGSATLRFAYLPDEGGHWLLAQTIGVPATIDFLLRQRIVDGREAYEMGLVHAVCPLADLPERTANLAREMAEGPQGAMRFLKKAVYRAADQTLAEALDDIGVRTAITDHLADAKEGGRAFVEKRKANFGQE
jgi:2-(1,2-epoxy-1,2-dihydrophenyl)acetyl-CoA isomerase